MQIVSVGAQDTERIEQMARLLVEGFRSISPTAWATFDEGLEEVHDLLQEGICRAAVDDSGALLGFVGGRHSYSSVWELHPLIVVPGRHGEGIGRALVSDMEAQARERGALTLMLGTDDEADLTTLSGVDLYTDIPGYIAQAKGNPPHALEFYRRLGYTITGVVPDANGYGKPDILLAKRL